MSTPPSSQFNGMSPSASNPGRAAAVADLYVLQGEASSSVEKIALKFGETFMVLDTRGDLPESEQETGLYWHGARFMRSFDLFLDGKPLTGLSHSVSDEEGTCQIDLTNPFLPPDTLDGDVPAVAVSTAGIAEPEGRPGVAQGIPHGVAHVRRRLTLRGRNLSEVITLTNYNETPITLTVGILASADFRDIFEIRGLHCSSHGRLIDPQLAAGEMTLSYLGADKVARETLIEFDPPAAEVGPALGADGKRRMGAGAALWRLTLPPGEPFLLNITVRLWEGNPETPTAQRWPSVEPPREESLRSRQLPAL